MPLVNCSECGHQVSTKATACPSCGTPLARGRATKAPKAKKPPIRIGCGTVLLLAFLGIVVTAMVNGRRNGGGSAPPPSSAPIAAPKVPIGGTGALDDGDTVCVVASDEKAFDELLDIQNAGGDPLPLIRAGRALAIPKGTRAKVISGGWGKSRVQFIDGPHPGELGWVQDEFVKP
jgi:hypothetical protein